MVSRSHLTCLCDSPVWSVLGVGQPEDVEKLVGAPDVVHPAPALGHRSQHQHVGAGPPEVTCSKGVKALLWIRILITYGVSARVYRHNHSSPHLDH